MNSDKKNNQAPIQKAKNPNSVDELSKIQSFVNRHYRHEKYTVGNAISRGGFGTVYELLGFPKEAVIKIVSIPDIISRHGSQVDVNWLNECIQRERRFHEQFGSRENTVRLLDAFEVNRDVPERRYLCIVMEKMEPLDRYYLRIKKTVVHNREVFALSCAEGILLALMGIHGEGVVHRDIKPSNIFVGYKLGQHRFCLGDFGISRGINKDSFLNTSITPVGTLGYSSPELLDTKERKLTGLSYNTDLYSLGVVMYELITGKLPESYQYYEIKDVSKGTNGILKRALQKDPRDRYQAAVEMLADVKEELFKIRIINSGDPIPKPDSSIMGSFNPKSVELWRKENDEREALIRECEKLLKEHERLKKELKELEEKKYRFKKELERNSSSDLKNKGDEFQKDEKAEFSRPTDSKAPLLQLRGSWEPLNRVISQLDGLSISDREKLTLTCAKDILDQLRRTSCLHRAVNPRSILVSWNDGEYRFRLCDYGSSIKIDFNRFQNKDIDPYEISEYCAPELRDQQIRAKMGLTLNADLYSLGVMMHEMMTGKALLTAEAISGGWNVNAIIRKSMQKDNRLRYQTADDMLTDVRNSLSRIR